MATKNENPTPKVLVFHFGERLAHYAYHKSPGKVEYVTLVKGPNHVDMTGIGVDPAKFFDSPEARIVTHPAAIAEIVRMKPDLVVEGQSVIGLMALADACPDIAPMVRERIQKLRK